MTSQTPEEIEAAAAAAAAAAATAATAEEAGAQDEAVRPERECNGMLLLTDCANQSGYHLGNPRVLLLCTAAGRGRNRASRDQNQAITSTRSARNCVGSSGGGSGVVLFCVLIMNSCCAEGNHACFVTRSHR